MCGACGNRPSHKFACGEIKTHAIRNARNNGNNNQRFAADEMYPDTAERDAEHVSRDETNQQTRTVPNPWGQTADCPRRRVLYGTSRSASDANTLVYTTTSVLRGRRTPPVGSDGSCVASYRLFLAWILVKVFVSVTENR